MAQDIPREEWYKDKVFGVAQNLERPGADIIVSVNGYNFQIQDGAEITVPKVVMEVLNSAIKIVRKNRGIGLPPLEKKVPRYSFTEIKTLDREKDELKKEIIKEAVEAKRETSRKGMLNKEKQMREGTGKGAKKAPEEPIQKDTKDANENAEEPSFDDDILEPIVE